MQASDTGTDGGESAEAESVAGDPQRDLSVLFAEVGARMEDRAAHLYDHTTAAVDAYVRIHGKHPELRELAHGAVATVIPRVLLDAAEARILMRDDPAAPELERDYGFFLGELSALAMVCASASPESGCEGESIVPDPRDEYAADYHAVCEELGALIAAAAIARPVWRLLRQSYAAARRRPPARRTPRPPLADDREYYL
jgi:hypothetical protein